MISVTSCVDLTLFVSLSVCLYTREFPQFLRERSKILHTSFPLLETTHLSKPISDCYNIYLPYKLYDQNQVLIWKTFLFDVKSSIKFARIFVEGNSTIAAKAFNYHAN